SICSCRLTEAKPPPFPDIHWKSLLLSWLLWPIYCAQAFKGAWASLFRASSGVFMMKKLLICSSLSLILAGVVACSPPGGSSDTVGSSDDNGNTPSDITNYVFTKTDPSCSAYIGEFTSTIKDLGKNRTLEGSLSITTDGSTCTISSNSIPNHDVNDTGAFATTVSEVNTTFRVPVSPTVANSPTQLSLAYDNAVFLNGAKLDLLAAACYGIGRGQPLGQEKIGCFQTNTPWRYDPMSPLNQFGTDSHNAHTQPNGAYHYHGDPVAMYVSGGKASGVIGFAADGFPIYGPFIDDNGDFRRVTSSYVLRSGARQSQSGEGAFPGGNYDGTYVDDYKYQAGSGDLDECNGRVTNGRYGYYVTSSYPWVMKCFKGTPDNSFQK
ncbi:MAG: YHYH protein, partial [Deltaproteobacteria bacterium]